MAISKSPHRPSRIIKTAVPSLIFLNRFSMILMFIYATYFIPTITAFYNRRKTVSSIFVTRCKANWTNNSFHYLQIFFIMTITKDKSIFSNTRLIIYSIALAVSFFIAFVHLIPLKIFNQYFFFLRF
jgi:hypothetical protein